jgi:hypothetical protein
MGSSTQSRAILEVTPMLVLHLVETGSVSAGFLSRKAAGPRHRVRGWSEVRPSTAHGWAPPNNLAIGKLAHDPPPIAAIDMCAYFGLTWRGHWRPRTLVVSSDAFRPTDRGRACAILRYPTPSNTVTSGARASQECAGVVSGQRKRSEVNRAVATQLRRRTEGRRRAAPQFQGHVPARVWGFESPLRHQEIQRVPETPPTLRACGHRFGKRRSSESPELGEGHAPPER